ncbi:MAG: hypothetical protein PHQ02_09575, partial [Candidatus Riflebacteria bacterium]|nr:hypothetical protein [Candidatus Riflebacteria bacterium]
NIFYSTLLEMIEAAGLFRYKDFGFMDMNAPYCDVHDSHHHITDSMPREGQISFAASIIANRVMQQGITGENEGFVKNIGNKFNLEEINTLKSEVRASALIKNKESHEIDAFLKNFDELIDIQKKTQLESAKEQQAQPKYNNPADVFFRSTMLMRGI